MKQETTNQPLPLYKVLNQQRTKGEWAVGRNDIQDYPESDLRGIYRKGKLYMNAPGWSEMALFYRHEINESDLETESNAKYTALAVNELANIAEALEYFAALPLVYAESQGMTEAVIKAKQAMQRII